MPFCSLQLAVKSEQPLERQCSWWIKSSNNLKDSVIWIWWVAGKIIVSFTSSSLDSGLTWPINSDIAQDEMVTKDIKMGWYPQGLHGLLLKTWNNCIWNSDLHPLPPQRWPLYMDLKLKGQVPRSVHAH